MKHFTGLLTVLGLLVFSMDVSARVLPADARDKHLGVASCASKQCHGAVRGDYKKSNMHRDEYRIWANPQYAESVNKSPNGSKHSRAYKVLLEKKSVEMAKKLGLKNAHEAKICLDCHADNVPVALRGEKFQIDDGIGCEACHGGSDRYIKSHTERYATHQDNVDAGMYPTELEGARAELCLSCHYGTNKQFATHRIMAAGHPRLSFELDTYTIDQEHYDIDADYKKRKRFAISAQVWATGIAETSKNMIRLIQGERFTKSGIYPEVALFDCHACHHTMNDKRWAKTKTTIALDPGAIRLSDSSLIMLYSIASVLSADSDKHLLDAIQSLHKATTASREAVIKQSQDLEKIVDNLLQQISHFDFTKNKNKPMMLIRKQIVTLGSNGEFRDYNVAEQAVMAFDMLTYSISQDQYNAYVDDLDALYKLLENDSLFDPALFAAEMTKLLAKIS